MKTLVLGMIVAILVLFSAPLRSAAITKPALEVVVLGSGGPRAFGRAGSSYIVKVDGRPRILVDAGPGAFLRIGELQLDLEKVDTVLLTHLHIDHSADLAAFFNARALTSDGPIRTGFLARTGQDYSPRPRDLWICWWAGGAFAYQKTFGARETFTVRDLAISLDSRAPKLWMRMAWWWKKLRRITATVRRWLTGFLIKSVVGGFLRRHGCIRAAESGAIGEECGFADF